MPHRIKPSAPEPSKPSWAIFEEHLEALRTLYGQALAERGRPLEQWTDYGPLLEVVLSLWERPARIVEESTGRIWLANRAAWSGEPLEGWRRCPLPPPLQGYAIEWHPEPSLLAAGDSHTLEMMSAVIAHRMRSVLTGIVGFASLIQQEAAGQPEIRDNVRHIAQGAVRLERMVQDLLQFSQPLLPRWRRVCARSLLCDLQEAFAYEYPQVQIELDADPVSVEADEALLRQAWIALLLNALEAAVQGTPRIRLRLRASPPELEVRNWGPVIPKALREKIFWPFFTTKAQNLGLGLAIARKIAHLHGASLDLLESDPDRGTAFRWRWA
ncbi:MAG: HAMP domain-containing sensor histidine kinase [Bacteroidota bacterium]|nr:HAMP domain-containing histidine kinase [Bacteroidota bacterium]MDW8137449.1 HAMP domain-containing sensor histidine kinase [Bacteroidota bacterium]